MDHDQNVLEPSNTRFHITVNGQPVALRHDETEGRTILRTAGFNPADEHVLIQLLRPGAKLIGLDDEADLREPGKEEFRAFATDRVFSLTIDEVGYEWGAAQISEPELRDIAVIGHGKILVLERREEPDRILGATDYVDLAARGVEHIRSESRLVTVSYNHAPFELERRTYLTAELRTVFSVPSGYVLDEIKPDGEFDELADGESIKVHDGMEFVSHAPSGQSS